MQKLARMSRTEAQSSHKQTDAKVIDNKDNTSQKELIKICNQLNDIRINQRNMYYQAICESLQNLLPDNGKHKQLYNLITIYVFETVWAELYEIRIYESAFAWNHGVGNTVKEIFVPSEGLVINSTNIDRIMATEIKEIIDARRQDIKSSIIQVKITREQVDQAKRILRLEKELKTLKTQLTGLLADHDNDEI